MLEGFHKSLLLVNKLYKDNNISYPTQSCKGRCHFRIRVVCNCWYGVMNVFRKQVILAEHKWGKFNGPKWYNWQHHSDDMTVFRLCLVLTQSYLEQVKSTLIAWPNLIAINSKTLCHNYFMNVFRRQLILAEHKWASLMVQNSKTISITWQSFTSAIWVWYGSHSQTWWRSIQKWLHIICSSLERQCKRLYRQQNRHWLSATVWRQQWHCHKQVSRFDWMS